MKLSVSKTFACVTALCFSSICAQQSAKIEDNTFPRLMYGVDASGVKSILFEAFLSLASTYVGEMDSVFIVEGLAGSKDSLISYDAKQNLIKVVADGAQDTSFEMRLVEHAKYGLAVQIDGTEIPTDTKFSDTLVRIDGGWININEGWKNLVTTSKYDVTVGSKKAEFVLHWVKDSETVIGYGIYTGNPTVTIPIKGDNFKEGMLQMQFEQSEYFLEIASQNGQTVWVSKDTPPIRMVKK